jgi:pyruvate dehydrogenase E2 component (dihydrolipoamide acetyltransferase)
MFRSTVAGALPSPQPDAPGALKGRTRVVEPDRSERAIGRRSAEVRATVPDLELSIDVDAGPILQIAERERVSTTAVLVAACAAALREFPRANAAYRDGHFELYSRVNVAVTLHSASSQVAATLLDADARPLAELDEELKRLRARALAGELTPPEQAGATFTLADVSEYGIHRAGALITPPQAAALTAGAVRAVPVVRDGIVTAGQLLTLTLACDHRILFGAQAAGFLAAIAGHLERG